MKLDLQTELCRRLNITYPVIQAGMAGGPTTAEMVAGVSNAGGLGKLGAAYMVPDAIRDTVRAIRRLTDRPFGVNLFTVDMTDDLSRVREVQRMLDPLREELGIAHGKEDLRTPNWFAEQFQVLLEEEVPVISTAFGVLPDDAMREAKAAGRTVMTMVTTVEEAKLAEEKGADVLVAQGSDAGGHRGTFDITKHPYGANIGTFSLVPQIVDNVRVPVVAAGGVMDGRGLVAALALGAQGVQLGTRFLTSAESGAHPAYKKALLESTEEDTVITKAFSGRPARGIRNAFIDHVENSGVAPLPFPSQNTATGDIRKEAAAQNDPRYLSLWAGQATRLLTDGDRAEEIVKEIIAQAQELLK
ncbi:MULTISPECIES: NAD(P)H-dependent flavin oxidoreductase [Aneurinibacillus]|jgi:nitronate monooxygenase|uniref:Probable nitronate monooxygenase n=1 Tax=Aneurinibacillus danicus TaxID=267746 RepID=A0A511VDQ1_9BACL|nr:MULTISPECIES: nitronate monooxygenase [Aneurinibacillus]GEN35713.1 nitronate monooxygenase [Aneurinibacillus danicus]